MVNKYAIGISLLFMLGWGTTLAGAASKEQRQTTWEGLSAIVGQKVRVVMPDGTRIEGRAKALEVDALVVEISKSSNKAGYPKGKFLVPRATLKAVDVARNTKRWQIVGVTAGSAVGVLVFVALVVRGGVLTPNQRTDAYAAAGGCIPVLGYLLGRAADRHTVTYVITP